MVFSSNILTIKNTLQSAPKHTKLFIARGVILRWDVFFPIGSRGELRFQVMRGSDHILPRNAGGYISGNRSNFAFPEHSFIRDAPYSLDIYSWNIDTVYDHEFILYVSQLKFSELYPFSKYYSDTERSEHLRGVEI